MNNDTSWKDIDGDVFNSTSLPEREHWIVLLFLTYLSKENDWTQYVEVDTNHIKEKCLVEKGLQETCNFWMKATFTQKQENIHKELTTIAPIINKLSYNSNTQMLAVEFSDYWIDKAKNSEVYNIKNFEQAVSIKTPAMK